MNKKTTFKPWDVRSYGTENKYKQEKKGKDQSGTEKNPDNLCVCLEHVGDNGPCPVHGNPPEK